MLTWIHIQRMDDIWSRECEMDVFDLLARRRLVEE